MFAADQYRKKAAEYAEAAKAAIVPSEIRDLKRSQKTFNDPAKNEGWLADNFDKMIGPARIYTKDDGIERRLDDDDIVAIEDRIFRCLGAALIMQWNTIPRELQRELFDTAGSFGDAMQTASLRGQIAHFLHTHEGKGCSAAGETSLPSATEGSSDDA